MLQRVRDRIGSAGLIVSVIALVLAVAGGAYAAGGGLSGKQKKEVEKIAKKYAGKPGAAGTAGANGKDGTNGTNGKDGTNGTNGTPGAPGTPVKVKPAITECGGRGGAIVEKEGEPTSAQEVCTGEEGEEGEPWTPNSQLPVNATETGTWVFYVNESAEEEIYVPLSFPIQLAGTTGLTAGHVHYESEANFKDFDGVGGVEIGCEGTTTAPTAPSGHLCVYGQANVSNATFEGIWNISVGTKGTTSKTGALLVFERGATGEAFGSGSFAVTG
jgi:hypothetical protein